MGEREWAGLWAVLVLPDCGRAHFEQNRQSERENRREQKPKPFIQRVHICSSATKRQSAAMKTWKTSTVTYLVVVIVISAGVMSQELQQAWEKPGCYLVGNTRRISIPGCVEFDIQTNACRGFCESYSVPSPFEILKNNQKHTVSSFAHCCSIVETEETRVRVWCKDGLRNLVFRSATSCACYRCKRT